MGPDCVVLPSSAISPELSLGSRGEQLAIEELISEPAVVNAVQRGSYDSANRFFHGDPGLMSAVVVVSLASHPFRRAWAIKSGPFSNRMTIGAG